MSAGSISVRMGAVRPARNLFQYWNNAIDPSSFMCVLRAFRRLMCHRRTEGAPSDGLYDFRSRLRASLLGGCSRLGAVKVNQWFRLCRSLRHGTSKPLHGVAGRGRRKPEVKSFSGWAGGSTSRPGETLDGFSFAANARARYMRCSRSILSRNGPDERTDRDPGRTAAEPQRARRACLQPAARRAGADRHLRGGASGQLVSAQPGPVRAAADQRGLHPDPLQRSVRSRRLSLHFAVHLRLPARFARAPGDQHDLARDVRVAARQPLGNAEVSRLLGGYLAGGRRLALCAAHARPGAADRRVRRHLGNDGRGGAIRFPHRSQPRPRSVPWPAACRSSNVCGRGPWSPFWPSG